MDMRKLISFGKGSYIVSMPKDWVQKNNLKKGDLISLTDDGAELTLSVNRESKKDISKEISIDAKKKDIELLKAEIVSAYLNGFDTISILFDQKTKDITKIKDIIRNLSGLEIMEQTSKKIVAKNLININEISVNNIIRRMDVITKAMMEDSILCLRGQEMDNIHHRDVDVNRLFFLGYRTIKNALKNPRIAKSLELETWHLHTYTLMLLGIEKTADRQKRIARFLQKVDLDKTTLNELDKLYTDISEAYNNVMKSFYNNDKETAYRIETTNRNRTTACNKFLKKYASSQNNKSKDTNLNLVSVAKIVENLKATAAETKSIARSVLCFD